MRLERSERVPFRVILLCLCCIAIPAQAAPREAVSADGRAGASADLIPESPRLGEDAELKITVTLPVGAEAVLPEFGESYGSMKTAAVKADPPGVSGGKLVSVFHVILRPAESGEVFLPPIPIRGRAADGSPIPLLIPAGSAAVTSQFDPDSVSLDALNDSDLPLRSFPWPRLIAGILSGLAAAFLLLWLLWRRRRKLRPQELSFRQRALRNLAILKSSGLAERDLAEYYVHLTGIVRLFIEELTGIRAPEQTTEEFLRHIKTDPRGRFSPEAQGELASFLEAADLVKFARFRPASEEVELGYRHAERFISTFQLPEEPPQGAEGAGR